MTRAQLCIVAASLALAATPGCRKGSGASVAELVEIVSGSAEKQISDDPWGTAAKGDSFRYGDAVRTSADGEARLSFGEGAVVTLGASTTVRFRRDRKLDVVGEIQAESGTTTLEMSFGQARLSKGGRIRIGGDKDTRTVSLLIGSASVRRVEGEEPLELTVGASIELGSSTIRRFDAAVPTTPDAGPPADAAPPDAAPQVGVSVVVEGRRVKVKRPDETKATRLPAGDHSLPAGSVVTVGRRSEASFVRGGASAKATSGANVTVGAPGQPLLSVKSGRVRVEATGADALVAVPGGRVQTRGSPRSRAEVNVRRRSSKISARRGRTTVTNKSGTRESIQIGEYIELSSSGRMQVHGSAPTVADFSISVGSSASIHDPGAPTAVRFRFGGKCSSEGIIEVARNRRFRSARQSKGSGSANVLLAKGSYSYRLRCLVDGEPSKEVAGSGRVRVDGSSGTKKPPAKPNRAFVDVDGRTNTIDYQNLLPMVTFTWPGADDVPATLHVKPSTGAAKTYRTKGSSHRLKSGTLKEGNYVAWFSIGSRKSKETVVRVVFSNDAVTGYLRSPKVGAGWGGGQLRVRGATIRGGKVSVQGNQLPLDSQYRFDASVARPSGQNAIAIKFTHPKSGTHYYIRRDGRR